MSLSLEFNFGDVRGVYIQGEVRNATCEQLTRIINVLNELNKIINNDDTISGDQILQKVKPFEGTTINLREEPVPELEVEIED